MTLVPPTNNSGIVDTRLSPDKQWLLFSTYTQDQDRLDTQVQLIRTDGNMLQTLYKACASPSLGNNTLAWSPDEQQVAFSTSLAGIDVLNLATGQLQKPLWVSLDK